MKLSELIKGLSIVRIVEPERQLSTQWPVDSPETFSAGSVVDHEIASICYRAQEVVPGGIFVAIPGFKADGHNFIENAVKKGAFVIVSQRPAKTNAINIIVENSRKALADLSARFYGYPSGKLVIIGVTGTNGKTTTSYLIESILEKAGLKVGVIGTINYRYPGKVFVNPVTTPESLDLQRILYEMVSEGISHVVMEVSSHAIDLGRIENCWMDVAVFTNLTLDHLDYHGSMEAYWNCKKRLFTHYLVCSPKKDRARAVINCNDKRGKSLLAKFPLTGISVGKSPFNMVYSENVKLGPDGIQCTVWTPYGAFQIKSSLVGEYNLENILSATGVGVVLNLSREVIKSGIEKLKTVPGRLERVPNDIGRFVYVDYAHTPDALENVLKTLRALASNRLICVYGCGGDRDRAKRPLMGEIAAKLSDLSVITSDNPRSEAPLEIIEEILAGVRKANIASCTVSQLQMGTVSRGYVVVADRKNAIQTAVRASFPGDTILIAGKGHEAYQTVGTKTVPFDDRLEAKIALAL
ncbi:MAG: UDP-N-acetylmuramoyl-L-alanyl-D-glutamate--2,6-diaminopimelate ligase [Desulfobacterales bacterium]